MPTRSAHAPIIACLALAASSAGCRSMESTQIMLTVDSNLRYEGADPQLDAIEVRVLRLVGPAMGADAGTPSDAGETIDGSAAQPDAGQPDALQPDAGQPDAGQPDAGQPDAGQPDAGVGELFPCTSMSSVHTVLGEQLFEVLHECRYSVPSYTRLPFQIGVLPEENVDLSQLRRFEAVALRGGVEITRDVQETGFIADRIVRVALWLDDLCADGLVECPPDETCRGGGCVSIAVPPDRVPGDDG
jgi:hypothetical protein